MFRPLLQGATPPSFFNLSPPERPPGKGKLTRGEQGCARHDEFNLRSSQLPEKKPACIAGYGGKSVINAEGVKRLVLVCSFVN